MAEATSLLKTLMIMGGLVVLPLGIKIMHFLLFNKEESTAKLLAKSADGIAATAQSLSNSADAIKTTAQSLANSAEDITSIANSLSSSSDFKSFGFLLSILSLEFILIYFFRIILSNYKSVKAQIVQIELRQTLCEFIQGYADYRKDIKESDKSDGNPLEKFENLIFSGISTDSDKLPSTFDGIDQLGSLIKAVKGK